MEPGFIKYFKSRDEWRLWLKKNYNKKAEIWLIFPKKSSGKPRILYNDAVEEALCFGWIDSTQKNYDRESSIQRFTPRRANSSYSQTNKERLKWLEKKNLLHSSVKDSVQEILMEDFVFPNDIIGEIKKDEAAWEHFRDLSGSYKRIRIAYINAARNRPEEFGKRLKHFIHKTRENKIIKGHGGIEKYY